MSNILHFRPRPRVENYFGGCPRCGCDDGYMNVGGNHWFVCRTHMTRWCVGYNLFSGWREEGEDVWRCNAEELHGFTQVEPLTPSKGAAS